VSMCGYIFRHRFKFQLLAGQVSVGGKIAPSLAPFGLELSRLVKELNDQTCVQYSIGIPVRVEIKVFATRKWDLKVLSPSLSVLLRSLVVDGILLRLDFWDLLRLICLPSNVSRSRVSMFLGSLRSFGTGIKFDSLMLN